MAIGSCHNAVLGITVCLLVLQCYFSLQKFEKWSMVTELAFTG